MASYANQILTVIFILFSISSSSVYSGQIQINLSNDFSNQNLRVNCKSSTCEDLGIKVMGPGTNFTWAADINVPGKIEYWLCVLTSIPGNLCGLYVIFNSDRDSTWCGQECLWSVREDGIYLDLPSDGGYSKLFLWRYITGCP